MLPGAGTGWAACLLEAFCFKHQEFKMHPDNSG